MGQRREGGDEKFSGASFGGDEASGDGLWMHRRRAEGPAGKRAGLRGHEKLLNAGGAWSGMAERGTGTHHGADKTSNNENGLELNGDVIESNWNQVTDK